MNGTRDYVFHSSQQEISGPNNNYTLARFNNDTLNNSAKSRKFIEIQETRDNDEDYRIARSTRIDLVEYQNIQEGVFAKYITWCMWITLIEKYETSKASNLSSEMYFNNLTVELRNLLSNSGDDYYAGTERAVRLFLSAEGYQTVPGFESWDFKKMKQRILISCRTLKKHIQELTIKIDAIKGANPATEVFFTNKISHKVEIYTEVQIGKGQFAIVYEGKMTANSRTISVAVKALHYKNHFWREMNVINKLTNKRGVAVMEGYNSQLGYIVFKLAEGGNLENALKSFVLFFPFPQPLSLY